MISRRQFTKTLGGAVTLTAIKPDALWSGEPTATATPASVSPVAAELYRKVFVLDGNVLGAIGFPISNHDPVGVDQADCRFRRERGEVDTECGAVDG